MADVANPQEVPASEQPKEVCRVLSLDGGGAKGFYTLGVLREIEAMVARPLSERFDLIFGTSTGAIIASLLALGYRVEQIHDLYKTHVPTVMAQRSPAARTAALEKLAAEVFGERTFDEVKTGIGIVATRWMTEKPMIFKSNDAQAHGRKGTFIPGFGVRIADAVQASCSAYPFFERKFVVTSAGDRIELIDGGYCANNPTLYAIADAVLALRAAHSDLRVVSIGVGVYPEPKPSLKMWFAKKYLVSVQLLQKTLEINTQSMDQLREVLFREVPTIRISDTFERPEMATDLMEHDLAKLNLLRQRGSESFASREARLREFLL
ncbi:patatin-like phospholipase family protein [Klebsiella pneumoniae]|nr:patatin-like phospholipase family protein [Klebsiella pneumoniae]